MRAIVAAGIATLALWPASPASHAEVTRTGSEPWYQQSTTEARRQANALFEQAVDKHLQHRLGDASELYMQALELWDNPDIRWNLALVLKDLGRYLAAHKQLERTLRWDAALGAERRSGIRDRLRTLEAVYLARIEVYSEESRAEIELDGEPWFRGPGHRSKIVLPGRYYIVATKPGYAPTVVPVVVAAGQQSRVSLRMNRLIGTRRWSRWKPWSVVAAGIAVAAVGAGLEQRAFAHRSAAVTELRDSCSAFRCEPRRSPKAYDRAVMESRLATGAFVAGGTTVAVGLALAWLNQPRLYPPEEQPSPVELIPAVSRDGAGVSALVRF